MWVFVNEWPFFQNNKLGLISLGFFFFFFFFFLAFWCRCPKKNPKKKNVSEISTRIDVLGCSFGPLIFEWSFFHHQLFEWRVSSANNQDVRKGS